MTRTKDRTLRNHAIAIGVAKGLSRESAATRHDIEHGYRPTRKLTNKPSRAQVKRTTRSQRP